MGIRNLGVDGNNQLKLFDFGSIMHRDDENYYNQVVQDHFDLASPRTFTLWDICMA